MRLQCLCLRFTLCCLYHTFSTHCTRSICHNLIYLIIWYTNVESLFFIYKLLCSLLMLRFLNTFYLFSLSLTILTSIVRRSPRWRPSSSATHWTNQIGHWSVLPLKWWQVFLLRHYRLISWSNLIEFLSGGSWWVQATILSFCSLILRTNHL